MKYYNNQLTLNCIILIFLAKSRKIRFKDDDSHDPDEPEKDTRLKYKGPVTSLQAKMLKMAGQQMPVLNDRQVGHLVLYRAYTVIICFQ